jgi:hypothetical protein
MGFMLAGFFENNFTDAEVQFLLLFVIGMNFALFGRRDEEVQEKFK